MFIFLIAFVGICFSGCNKLEKTAKIEIIGIANIQMGKGANYVEVDSMCYVPTIVYSGESGRDGEHMIAPIEGMKVTCFRLNNKPEVLFFAGEQTQEYLEGYFSKDYFIITFLMVIIIFVGLMAVYIDKKRSGAIK